LETRAGNTDDEERGQQRTMKQVFPNFTRSKKGESESA